MGAWLSQFLVKRDEYDTNDPSSRMKIDLRFEEQVYCHNYYASRAKYYTMEVYGAVFGVLLTTFMPRKKRIWIRLAPFYLGMLGGIGWDMNRVERRCKEEQEICDEVVNAHKMMISAGHPPFPPVAKDWIADEEDKWAHLRYPPLILRREFIENWDFINVNLPKDRDEDELTTKELEQRAIDRNAEYEAEMRKKYEVI
mmetsp:Transcript_15847/g.25149  ORF Transcript_15847/g.25149 Transcript_15847/m.25149 type:complete len:198 (-) Transcript_15847:75-668(-)|eukprot:CAMPEP_0197043996 /NCGR_PEP_ID=MMETSP1384-20130603/20155_1 /TAXON_ID=29189 /ORGANISM="Ammonia sp." /LENGTH=197 /DNA_ID=CAMNT_0042475377 /DNA_START=33 /DNA_END=626 /DNA_ORIENTATION=-